MVSFMLAQCQIMILPLDLINLRENTNVDMFVFWQVIYMSSLFMCTTFLPFAYFFYDTEEDKDYKTRFCTAFKNTIFCFLAFSLIHMPMFSILRHALIPVESLAYKGLQGTPSQSDIDNIFLNLDDGRTVMEANKAKYEFNTFELDT